MNYEERDTYGMYVITPGSEDGPGPRLMGAHTLIGNPVCNADGDDLGEIKEIMLNVYSGRIEYAVLTFGGFLGFGEKLFALPWQALTLDTMNKRFVLNASREMLENAPGFDKGHWPDMADPEWAEGIHAYYGVKPYRDELKPYRDPLHP